VVYGFTLLPLLLELWGVHSFTVLYAFTAIRVVPIPPLITLNEGNRHNSVSDYPVHVGRILHVHWLAKEREKRLKNMEGYIGV